MESTPGDLAKPSTGFDRTKLGPTEIFWAKHAEWLKEQGYQLRPRYMPGWKASWIQEGGSQDWMAAEDGRQLRRGTAICDATRISDGAYVSLKIVKPSVHPYEADIITFLSSAPLAADPKNHCVPVYEILQVPDEEDKILLVMPLLRWWNRPPLQTVGEGIDLFRQIFEGVQFMHKHHVAHRDISPLNILMDGSMFPNGWHPASENFERNNPLQSVKHSSRVKSPPKYYFIDFGISRRYEKMDPPPLELPIRGGIKGVPEYESLEPSNPFPTDIWYLGQFLQEFVIGKYKGFNFMQPLAKEMLQTDPTKRPTIDQVLERFETIQNKLGSMKLRSPAGSEDEEHGALYSIAHFFKSIIHTLRGVPAVPTHR